MSDSTTKQKVDLREETAAPVPSGLPEYTGEWNYHNAAHLLRRATFGASHREIKQSVRDGLSKTIEKLFRPIRNTPEPINYYFKNDPKVPIGETWVGKAYTRGVNGLSSARNNSLWAWVIGRMMEERMNISPKIMLFWHNHLVVSNTAPAEINYYYLLTLRKHGLGDFKQMMKDITVDAAMLRYLNGNTSTKRDPNENYARELMELFTLGKGPLAGPGDYTTYTEHDIKEIARALTGWTYNGKLYKGYYVDGRHDKGEKKLSHRFDNRVIKNAGGGEYKQVIDIIFEREEVAPFICRKLYLWFVNSNITEEVEKTVIQPLANQFRAGGYQVQPVLEALLKSQHFYDECPRGSIIKSPIDYLLHMTQTLNFEMPKKLTDKYYIWRLIFIGLRNADQAPFYIPSVAGWPAYYQEPVYYKYWISAVSLPQRKKTTNDFIYGKIRKGKTYYGLQLVDVVDDFDNPFDPNALVKQLADLVMPYPLTDKQLEYLKTIGLIPGLPDFEWTEEYGDYRDNPKDETKKKTVLNRLRHLMDTMLNLPEYQMM